MKVKSSSQNRDVRDLHVEAYVEKLSTRFAQPANLSKKIKLDLFVS